MALDAAILTEVVTVRRGADGLRLSRQALGGRVAETKVWDGSRPLVITVPTRTLSQVLMPTVRPSSPVVASWQPAAVAAGPAATVISRIPPDPQTVDLTEAEVIFSAGKGCDPATFEQLKELCRLLNVSFGVTRPVYDLGWTGFERMVGQTGRTVTPRLYVALGISGSMHHVGGIKDSRRIVAVNSDAKAPIFHQLRRRVRGRSEGSAAAPPGTGQSDRRRCTMSKTYQAIVVGAGPAGSSAALTMARAGLDVALVERGTFPGEKNMFGGILHRMTSIEELLPDFWTRAPLERHIAKKGTTFMTGGGELQRTA